MAKQYWRKAKYFCVKDGKPFWGTHKESLEYSAKANACTTQDILYVKVARVTEKKKTNKV